MESFYKLTTPTIDQVIAADLPKSAHKLWLWICRLDPFGDRLFSAPQDFLDPS